jgi:uncharacterized membrane protein
MIALLLALIAALLALGCGLASYRLAQRNDPVYGPAAFLLLIGFVVLIVAAIVLAVIGVGTLILELF